MPTIRDIRRRIRVVKNIEQITNAMKMVAAARLRKAQDKAEAGRPYAQKMREVMDSLAAAAVQVEHPLLEVRPEENVAVLVIGADRGLAGAYMPNIWRKAMELLGEREPARVRLFLAGRKAEGFFRRRPYEIAEVLGVPVANVSFADIRGLTGRLRAMFEQREVDAVYLVYAKFVTAMTQRPTIQKLLPVVRENGTGQRASATEYIFEPAGQKLFADLLPRYVDTLVYSALLEAAASESGARLTAMSAATNNVRDMIDDLTLAYNKARQAAITKELTEIVTSAEALR